MASISGMLTTDVLVTRGGETFRLDFSTVIAATLMLDLWFILVYLPRIWFWEISSKSPWEAKSLPIFVSWNFPVTCDLIVLCLRENQPRFWHLSTQLTKIVNPCYHLCCLSQLTYQLTVVESRNIALQGTLCTSGSGVGVCIGQGDRTVFGRIAKQATSERQLRTTMEVEILRFVFIIASLAVCVAIFIVGKWFLILPQQAKTDILNISFMGCLASTWLPWLHKCTHSSRRLCQCSGRLHSW